MRFRMSGCLWMQWLTITITEFRVGNGCIWSRVCSMNLWNFAVSKAPSMMSQWRTPSRDSVRSTKYLEHESSFSLCYAYLWYWSTYLFPQQKKAFLVAFIPCVAHAWPLYVVWWLTALSLTKTSCLGSNIPIQAANIDLFLTLCSSAIWESWNILLVTYSVQLVWLHTFFMLYPPFTKVLHVNVVDVTTDTPWFSSSSRHSSSKYTSGVLLIVFQRYCEYNLIKQVEKTGRDIRLLPAPGGKQEYVLKMKWKWEFFESLTCNWDDHMTFFLQTLFFFCFPSATGITCCGSMQLFGLWHHLLVIFSQQYSHHITF